MCGTPAPNPDLVVSAASWTPGVAERGQPDHPVRHGPERGLGRPPGRRRSTSAWAAPWSAARRWARSPPAPRPRSRSTPAPGRWAATASRRWSTRPTRSSSRTTPTTASPRPRSSWSRQAPGPDLQVLEHQHQPAEPGGRRGRSRSPWRSTTAAPARPARPPSPGWWWAARRSTPTPPSIAAGATANVAISGSWTATSGGATITATADATNVVAETNEGNNARSQSIVVGRGAAVPYVSYEAEAASYQGTLRGGRPAAHVRAHQLRHRVLGPQVGAAEQQRPVRRVHLDQRRPTRSWCATPSPTRPAAAVRRPRSACTSTARSTAS